MSVCVCVCAFLSLNIKGGGSHFLVSSRTSALSGPYSIKRFPFHLQQGEAVLIKIGCKAKKAFGVVWPAPGSAALFGGGRKCVELVFPRCFEAMLQPLPDLTKPKKVFHAQHLLLVSFAKYYISLQP